MIDIDKICVLETMDGFRTLNFNNSFVDNQRLMAESLKYKGLLIPSSKRGYGGRKIRQEFYKGETLAVSIDYTDIINNDTITHINKHCKYYCLDGSIYCEKEEKELVKNEDKLKRSRNDYAYAYLKDSAKGTPIESYVNKILSHYSNEVSIWLLGNTEVFLKAVLNEENKEILTYLNIVVDSDKKKVKDSIIEQLTGEKHKK